MALNSGSPPGIGPYYENHGYQSEHVYSPRPPVSPSGYNLYPAQSCPSPVPQYAPRVTTQASTPAIHIQPRSSGTLCTSKSKKSMLVALALGTVLAGAAVAAGLLWKFCEQLIHVALSPTSFVFNNLLQENQGADFQLPVHNVPFEMIQRAFHFY
ncbi:transmembrane protease, serine 2, isoform CRA_e [Rattus norvegicus]|uniref:Transmembrane protease, serine 2, isoform CRA_e n=1 Tax=Rattus norvegicus TaxID=10116 RepID=A6IQG7_RAT|nr:transmembrane protease, serine 2, isoform CRA_e [Rattus norvegicus]